MCLAELNAVDHCRLKTGLIDVTKVKTSPDFIRGIG